MTALALAILGVTLLGCLVVVAAALRRWHTGGPGAERVSLPEALRNAELAHVEGLFRLTVSVSLVARIDRAYRLPSGVLVLVEFKTRWINRTFWSDVVQLSAQRLAMEGQGLMVAPYGYVVVKRPIGDARYTAHRVELMSGADVVALVHRREDILAGRVRPRHAEHPSTCWTCAFRSECERPSIPRRAGRNSAVQWPRS